MQYFAEFKYPGVRTKTTIVLYGNFITLYPQKLAITSPTSGGRSVGIVRSRTQTMELFVMVISLLTATNV
jgi:hypothetical protein